MEQSILFFIIHYYPIIMNMSMILIMSIPSKTYKFNPITLIILLIMLTLLISLKMNMMINSWSSFTLFLIMIGGLMIIFMYITSLSNNELFKLNYKIITMNFIKIYMLMILILLLNMNLFEWNNSNNWTNMFFTDPNLNFYQIFFNPYNNNSLFLMNYLFYSMICIMNICYKFKSPLRQLYF